MGVLVTPFFTQANPLPAIAFLFHNSAPTISAQVTGLNSQTIPLLQPAVNLDPNPPRGGGDIAIAAGSALVAEDGPSGTIADIEETPQSSQISIYTVRSGDTLSEIAEMFDVSVNTIIWANDIEGRVIHPGQELVILPITGLRHTVVKGETLASLAKKYKGDLAEIASYNELEEDAALAVGQVVIIPHGEVPAPAPSVAGSSKPTAPLKGAGGPDYASFYTWPVNGGVVTQGLHGYNGVDIGAPLGTNIIASASGNVIIARSGGAWNGGYGNYIVVQHNNGTQTLYAHANTISVSVGQAVTQGQTIGTVGRTGQATGYHLHFEIRGAKNPFGK